MKELWKKAEKYIDENANRLQKACMNYVAGRGDKLPIIDALSTYQNPDGGWANGLEIEYPGPVSSPFTTAAALGYIAKFGLSETKLLTDTLAYLKKTQQENGRWDDAGEMLQYPHPPYMGPGIYPEYKTGMILKWLLRLGVLEKEMINRAQAYLIRSFDDIAVKNDFWSAVAYSSAFSLLPHVEECSRIMEWSMSILMPQGVQFGWQQAMGMIEDDMPVPGPLEEEVIGLIRQNQESDGGWPHPFGTYNKVWSAIYILRFLKNKGLA